VAKRKTNLYGVNYPTLSSLILVKEYNIIYINYTLLVNVIGTFFRMGTENVFRRENNKRYLRMLCQFMFNHLSEDDILYNVVGELGWKYEIGVIWNHYYQFG